MSFASDGEGGGHRTRFIRLWRPTFYQSELHPHFQRPIRNPDLGRGLVLIARMHSDPQDTTPQMTLLPIILTKSRLEILSITSIHLHYCRYNCSAISGASGRTRTCVHFVRSEGHRSSLARTLNCLVRVDGIEPPTPRSQGECASRLRYTRTNLVISTGGCPRYRTGLSGFSDQRFHLISLAAS